MMSLKLIVGVPINQLQSIDRVKWVNFTKMGSDLEKTDHDVFRHSAFLDLGFKNCNRSS